MKSTIHHEQQRKTLLKYGDFKYVPVQIWLKPVVDHWMALYSAGDPGYELVTKTIKKFPELLEPVDDVSILAEHQDFMDALFAPVFPKHGWINSYQAVTPPFTNMPWVVATDQYVSLFNEHESQFDLLNTKLGRKRVDHRLMYFYKAVFKKFYDLDLAVEEPIIASCLNKQTGLKRFFKLTGNTKYVDIVNTGPLPEIETRTLQGLLDRPFDPMEWEKVLPMDNFLFRGVTFITLIDVTLEEAATRLQIHLLENHGGLEEDWFALMQQEFRNLFKIADLRLGIATLQRNGQLNTTSRRPLWNSLTGRDLNGSSGKPTIYEDVLSQPRTVIIEDIVDDDRYSNDPIIRNMVDQGYRNLLLTPLFDENKLIGIMELVTSIPGAINGLSLFKFNRLKPMFSEALNRHSEEFEGRVKAVMLENFTAIHPSIEWKFRDAAIQILEARGRDLDEEGIVFNNLIPFYGSLDIRDSSKKRNEAILLDLQMNLQAARDLLTKAYNLLDMAVLDEYVYHIDQKLEAIDSGASNREQDLASFIRQKVNPVIKHLQQEFPIIKDMAELYIAKVCEDTGIYTEHRRAYEEALALLNNCIVQYLEREEEALEKQVPCYFDSYRTDGVEYNMYVGPDISPTRGFDPLYIETLQLQQLKWTCEIVRKVRDLQQDMRNLLRVEDQDMDSGQLAGALEIAPLILVYSDPITLKFRMDEKRLDVDGSYNVRYEIVKKRIDKATIAGSGERLTQPDHIGIVYTHKAEASAYIKHLEYLAARKDIHPTWEEFDLAPMPGTEGLKALRVKVM